MLVIMNEHSVRSSLGRRHLPCCEPCWQAGVTEVGGSRCVGKKKKKKFD